MAFRKPRAGALGSLTECPPDIRSCGVRELIQIPDYYEIIPRFSPYSILLLSSPPQLLNSSTPPLQLPLPPMLSFLHNLVNPVILFWVLTGLYFLARYKQRARLAKYAMWAAVSWLFLISTSPLPLWLTRQLEKQYTTLDTSTLPAGKEWHIVVLGGGHSSAPDLTAANRLSPEALGRLVEGIRLYRLLPGSKIVCSGYSQSGRMSQAETLTQAALDLGVDPADTLMLVKPAHTKAEARAYVDRFGKNTSVILVTSALHLPRAMGWFHRAGLEPIPAPTNHAVKIDPDRWTYDWLPSPRKIGLMQQATHEYAGRVLYWIEGI